MDLVPPEFLGQKAANVAPPGSSQGKPDAGAAKPKDAQQPQPPQADGGTTPTASPPTKSTNKKLSLVWLADTKCPEVSPVEWWRFNTHGAIARYVTRNLEGDWEGYREKWRERLENIADIYSRNSTAITNTGVRLSGTDLKDYIVKMRLRVSVIDCLAEEAKAFAEAEAQPKD